MGVEPSAYELEMFTVFRTETVRAISGTFNRDLWAVDVPRAAQTYPVLWHASLALAALQQRSKGGFQDGLKENAGSKQALATSRQHYVFALDQFNRSITCLGEHCRGDRNMSIMDQEMILLTNIVYIGICNMMGDTKQVMVHMKNTAGLIEHFRFGQNPARHKPPRSMLRYAELLSAIAFFYGQGNDFDEVFCRFDRGYAIKMPTYESFATSTEAYLAFLVVLYDGLKPINYARDYTAHARLQILQEQLEDYRERLDKFEDRRLTTGLSREDAACIAELRLFVRFFDVHYAARGEHTRQGRIEAEVHYDVVLDEVEDILEGKTTSNDPLADAYKQRFGRRPPKVPAFSFSYTVLVGVARSAYTLAVLRRAITLMKKYPFKEGSLDSAYLVARYEMFGKFMRRGPERTRLTQ